MIQYTLMLYYKGRFLLYLAKWGLPIAHIFRLFFEKQPEQHLKNIVIFTNKTSKSVQLATKKHPKRGAFLVVVVDCAANDRRVPGGERADRLVVANSIALLHPVRVKSAPLRCSSSRLETRFGSLWSPDGFRAAPRFLFLRRNKRKRQMSLLTFVFIFYGRQI